MPDYSYLSQGIQVDPFAIATKAQNLQNLRLANQGQQLANQGQQIANDTAGGNLNEIQQARALLSSPGALNPDGSLTEATRGKLAQVSPTLGSGISQGSAAANAEQTRSQMAHFQMSDAMGQVGLEALQGVYGDQRVMGKRNPDGTLSGTIDPTQATDAIMERVDQAVAKGANRSQMMMLASPLITAAGHAPNQLPTIVGSMYRSLHPAAAGSSYVDTGGSNQNTNPLAANTGAPQTLQKTLPPGQQDTVTTDVLGNPARLIRNPAGNVTGVAGIPGSAGPAPQMTYPPGESEKTKAQLETDRQSAQNVATTAFQSHANNQMVLQNIDKATVGEAGPGVNKALSIFGALPGFDTAEHAASSYDIVGKALERNALVAAQAMGPNTNAGLAAQIAANGSRSYNPTAIKEITKLNDALTTGAELYSAGLQTAISNSPNGIFAKRNFDTQWGLNFDVNAAKIYQAAKTGDTDQVREIVQSLGGPNSPAAKQMLKKAANIELLATQGHL